MDNDAENQEEPTFRMDKRAFQIVSCDDEPNEVGFWLEQDADKRLEAVELLRQSLFNEYRSQRLQRFLEIINIA